VIGPDGKIAQRDLELGPAIGATWLVTKGLAAGDRLVVEGTGKVKPGTAVRGVSVTSLPKME
jgi:membrane fusion protein (multidrug efflux system)